MQRPFLLAASMAALSFATPAAASQVNQTFNIDLASQNPVNYHGIILNQTFVNPFAVAEGDDFTLDVMFGGIPLSIRSVQSINMWFFSPTRGGSTYTGNLSFLGSEGNVLFSYPVATQTIGDAVLGQTFNGGSVVQAYGFRYQGHVDDYFSYPSTTDFTTRDYNSIFTWISGDGFRYVASVPEPATWSMLIIGLGAVGAGMRASRRGVGKMFGRSRTAA